MKKKFNRVYQFKIALREISPPVWRRIQVPETYSFWDLHVAIQDAMDWLDYHLHRFVLLNPSTGKKVEIGIPDEEWEDIKILPGWEQKISRYFSMENRFADYIYDFGDDWKHAVKFEKILPKNDNIDYPVCITGKRACPPEDCGGARGYEYFLEAVKNPKHEEHWEMLEWVGRKFDPEYFDPEEISFDDPAERLKVAFAE